MSAEEEEALLEFLDGPACGVAWEFRNFNGPSRGKRWGVITDLRKRTVSPARVPVPAPLAALAQRMVAAAPTLIPTFNPNGCNAIDYVKAAGHEITAHCDDRQLSGDILANLSLAGDAVMTYTSDREKEATGEGAAAAPLAPAPDGRRPIQLAACDPQRRPAGAAPRLDHVQAGEAAGEHVGTGTGFST